MLKLLLLLPTLLCALVMGPGEPSELDEDRIRMLSSIVVTGIPELDAFLRENTSYESGSNCYESDDENNPECIPFEWYHSRSFRVETVSSRLLSVLEQRSEMDAGGPPYHYQSQYIWGVREGRFLRFEDLVDNPTCLNERPGDDLPQQQEIYDLLALYRSDMSPAEAMNHVFEPRTDGFALWVHWAGITGPFEEEYELDALDFCGVKREFWENSSQDEQ